ncbi:hypothetical protein THRCLA_11528 [Thraustotheca clavata]|uniref:C2H2-type domain-containing protein n=1 Tax=Thraustotheca clavata TaxID=74557 RepID=A0A1V9Y7J8_9STRA|nr:hypothetical protein THRCLA_11528 [Thraustotheca clavata]
MMMRVLTLGDGDLSYSRCLLDKENWKDLGIDRDIQVQLTATTFDSLESLVEKYAMVNNNIDALQATNLEGIHVTVLHGIDATNLQQFEQEEMHFDRIVFNHPHTGVEDVHRHRRLLSHFFYAALQVLKPQGKIYITLARDQPKRWEILKRAVALDLVCCKHELWTEPNGYQRKRHQNDKSFHRVLLHGEKLEQQSTIFAFGRKSDGIESVQVIEQPSVPTAVKDNSTAFACTDPNCIGKQFTTAQGLKTHMRMVHELDIKKRKRGATSETLDYRCTQCNGRAFQDKEALHQHQISKHGKDSQISPDWYAATNQECTKVAPEQCKVCMELFPSAQALKDHIATLQPIASVKWTCTICGKAFEEQRALRQHQNFCQAN